MRMYWDEEGMVMHEHELIDDAEEYLKMRRMTASMMKIDGAYDKRWNRLRREMIDVII